MLAEHILTRLARQSGQGVPHLDTSAVQVLQQYPFAGNVRELENILERAMTLCESETIAVADLQLPEYEPTPDEQAATTAEAKVQLEDYLDNKEKEVIIRALEQTKYNKTAAAKVLGISFRALRYRLKKLDIE